jgi:formate-dependent nitrite reductase membrane component NrfD
VANSMTNDKSLPTLVSELWDLVVAYAKQETVDPLKTLGRFIKFGVAGSVLVAVGFVMLALGGLRALQQEASPPFSGDLSWVPYACTLGLSIIVALLLAWRINADRRRARRHAGAKGA